MRIYTFIFAIIVATSLMSCGESDEDIYNDDRMEIVNYLESNDLIDDAVEASTGFFYIIDTPGNPGKKPGLNSSVTCGYRGFYPNGENFDSSEDATFTLGNTIEGWRQGIPLIGEGGSIQLFIPSNLGYGRSGRGGIPGNQVLFFEVDLLKVN